MPFHAEIMSGFRDRANVYNLDEARLRRTIVEPWLRGAAFELADKEWDPRECAIEILEGPELAPPDLAHGQGWHNARRSGRNVTQALVGTEALSRPDAVAIVAGSEEARGAIASLLESLGLEAAAWGAMRARILAGGNAGLERAAAILVAEQTPDSGWMLDAGLALGALGRRAIVARIGEARAPEALDDFPVLRLDPADPATAQALAERLRLAVAP